jgi:hypothetical protein
MNCDCCALRSFFEVKIVNQIASCGLPLALLASVMHACLIFVFARYNNGETGFKGGALNNRMPYWLSAGMENDDGRIVFSWPEIVL